MQPKEHPRYDLALLIGFLLIVAALGFHPVAEWIGS
jgi:putative membrane protein